MDDKEIRALLSQEEVPKVDFKQKLKIYHSNPEVKSWSRDEFIKDLLALANGNALVAGQPGHLIFGVANELQEDGTRELFDVTGRIPTTAEILDIVNSACFPALEDISVEQHTINEKHLLVITVPPTPHLHETTRQLKTKPEKSYTKYTAFMRHNEQVRIASSQERATIIEAKRRHFKQQRMVKPAPFAAIVGAIMMGMQGWSVSKEMISSHVLVRTAAMLISGFVGAFTGWVFGLGVDQYLEAKQNWYRYSTLKKIALILWVSIWLVIGIRGCVNN